MSQHDFEIANQGFPSFRSDLNSGLQALASNSAGATEPSTTYAYQFWYDETTDILKMRNGDDDAWITLAFFDQTNDEWEVRSAVIQAVDSAGVVIKTDDGTTRLTIADDGSITTQGDFTVGGDLDVSSGTIKLDGDYPVGTRNVALGDGALDDGSLTGGNNTAVGHNSLTANTTGGSNVAVGRSTLDANTDGDRNTGLGESALGSNTSGDDNTAVGQAALFGNTTASDNTAVGFQAGFSNETGDNNTAVGYQALFANTTGTNNVAVGKDAMDSNTTGSYNVAVGIDALQANTTSQNNVAVGQAALINYTGTGGNSTCVGPGAGALVTTGSKNTILGKYDGNAGGLDIRTSSNYIVLSDGDGNPRIVGFNGGNVGIGTVVNGSLPSSGFWIGAAGVDEANASGIAIGHASGSGSGTTYVNFVYNATKIGSITQSGTTGVAYNTSSDYRLKENVVELTGATDRLKQLPVHRFNFISDPDKTVDGFIAHEAQAVVPESVTGEKDAVDAEGNPEYQGIDQSKLVPLLTAALKEAITEIESLKERVATLEAK